MKPITNELVKKSLTENIKSYGITDEELVNINDTINECVEQIMDSFHGQLDDCGDNFPQHVDTILNVLDY